MQNYGSSSLFGEGLRDAYVKLELLFKICLMGGEASGKSSLLRKAVRSDFSDTYNKTRGVEFALKVVETANSTVRLQSWEVSGAELASPVLSIYSKETNTFILALDLSNPEGLADVRSWLEAINSYAADNSVPIYLVGCKSDMQCEVSNEHIEEFMDDHPIIQSYIATSSKQGIGVDELFNQIANDLASQANQQLAASSASGPTTPLLPKTGVTAEDDERQPGCCGWFRC